MALTLPDNSTNKSVTIDWLFRFYYDDASDYIGMSSIERDVSTDNHYYGVVIDSGIISSDLNLAESKASVSDVTITCTNKFKNKSLADTLFANNFINDKVLIYEYWVEDDTKVLLYEGRLKSISYNQSTVTLTIEQKTPFDNIFIPNAQSTVEPEVYAPVVYGHFDANEEGGFCTNENLFPCPFHTTEGNYRYFATVKDVASGTAGANPHYYNKELEEFHPLNASVGGVVYSPDYTFTKGGIENFRVRIPMYRNFLFRPTDSDDSDYDSVNAENEFNNPDNAWDGNTGTSATSGSLETTTEDSSESVVLSLVLPRVKGYVTELIVYVQGDLEVESEDGVEGYDTYLQVSVDGSTWNTILHRDEGDGVGTTSTTDYDDTGDISGDLDSSNNELQEKLYLRLFNDNVGTDPGDSVTTQATVDEVYVEITVRLTDEQDSAGFDNSTWENLDKIYVGDDSGANETGDGLDADYTDGGGASVSTIIQAHRDIMDRYCGVDYDDDQMQNWDAAAPGNYDLTTARTSWLVRMWVLEPTPVKEVLEQLQYEGCFIFFLVADADGSGNAGGKYIWVQNDYDGDDVEATLTEDDVTPLEISLTDLSEVVTNHTYNFDKHPATGKYRQSANADNATARDLWNIGTYVKKFVDLDYLVDCNNTPDTVYDSGGDSDANDSIANYYDTIIGNPKIIVQCDVVNPFYMKVQLGDIVQFNDSSIDCFDKTWSNMYFMIVGEYRTKDNLSIIAREVYEAS